MILQIGLLILVSFFAILYIGIPCALLLQTKGNSDDSILILPFFLGISVIVLFCQNLLYLHLPISKTFYWLYLLITIGWLYLFFSRKIPKFSNKLLSLLVVASLIYLIQGMGILTRGFYYVGRGWHDQINYILTAQYLIHFPFSLSVFPEVQYLPYAIKAITLLPYRFGVSVLHGFITATTFNNAKNTFELTILFFPVLVGFVIYKMAKNFKLNESLALMTALVSGALPALAYVHLECFFAQGIAIPFLIGWPYILDRTIQFPHWKNFLILALILAALTSIYTEFYVLFIGLLVLSVIVEIFIHNKTKIQLIVYAAGIVIAALFLNVYYIDGIINTFKYINSKNVLSIIYPWGNQLEGLTRLWLGDLVEKVGGKFNKWLGIFSLFCLLISYLGFILQVRKSKSILAWCVLGLSFIPIFLIFQIDIYKYQFYKLILSISAIFPLGIVLFIHELRLIQYKIVKTILFILSVLIIAATLNMILRASLGTTAETIGPGGAFKISNSAFKSVQKKLTKIEDNNVVILWYDDFFNGNYINGWLNYFARNNHVWSLNSQVGDEDIGSLLPNAATIPDHFYLVMPSNLIDTNVFYIHKNLNWKQDPYGIIKIDKFFSVLLDMDAKKLLNKNQQIFFWQKKKPVLMKFFASRSGYINFLIQPNLIKSKTESIKINNEVNVKKTLTIFSNKGLSLNFPLHKGINLITIHSLSASNRITINKLTEKI